MDTQKKKYTVLMVGPASGVKGGIRTVVNQYLAYDGWAHVNLRYIPTHVEGSLVKKVLFFAMQYGVLLVSYLLKKPDIIHMHVSERGSFWRKMFVLGTFRIFGAKTVLHHHGAEFFSFYENTSEINKKRIDKTIRMADVNLVLSDYHCQMMMKRFPEGKFRVLYNAIPPADGGIYNPDATNILFVGRLGARKGTYDLITALEKLDDRLPKEVQVYFCGDGDVEKVQELLREKNLVHRVAHVGWCTKEQLRAFYKESMLFILPSYNEGLPMSLLEAMYAGIPCISTNVDGIPELLQSGSNGLLVEPGNIAQITDSLLQLVMDRELRKSIGKSGHWKVRQQFLLRSHIEDLENLYAELKGDAYV